VYTAYTAGLLDDADAATARGTLGLATTTTDNAICRYDSTAGATQNSAVTIGDTGIITLPGEASPSLVAGEVQYNTARGTFDVGAYQNKTASLPVVICAKYSTSDTLTEGTIATTETQFTTGDDADCQIPANFIIAGKTLRLTVGAQFLAVSSHPSRQFSVRLDNASGTVLYGPYAISVSTAETASAGFQILVTGTAAPGASANVVVGTVSTPINAAMRNTVDQPVAISTNAAHNLVVTLTYGAGDDTNTTTLTNYLLEALN
jgi:hypothetical protein